MIVRDFCIGGTLSNGNFRQNLEKITYFWTVFGTLYSRSSVNKVEMS